MVMNSSNKNEVADLLVVGAGVAGSAVALNCASDSCRVILLDRGDRDDRLESLSPASCENLKKLDIAIGTPFSKVVAWWGSHAVNEMKWPGAKIVQKKRLTKTLRNRAAKRVEVAECRTVTRCERDCGIWRVSYEDLAGLKKTVAAKNICDATGRASAIARLLGARRKHVDNLFSVTFNVREVSSVGTWTEAVPSGWWNICADGNHATLTFYTNPRVLRRSQTDLVAMFRESSELSKIVSIGPHFKARIRPCGSSLLVPSAGPGWFSAGDATSTLQPLASSGTVKALRDATAAPHRLGLDGRKENLQAEKEFCDYLRELGKQYRAETRWPTSDFWKQR